MRACALLAAGSLLLVGCGAGTPPTAYKHRRDRYVAAVPLAAMIDADLAPCFRTTDDLPIRLPDAECYRLTDARRMRGVALIGFERGSFYPGRTTLPPREAPSEIWVEPEPLLLPRAVRSRCKEDCAVYLDFIGRRTAVAGHYGHTGRARHMVIVDRIFGAKVLE